MIRVLLSLALALSAPAALAQGDFPNRPVRIVNPFPPGAANDILARIIANKLTERWKQPVLVENRTGAAGNIGMDHVAKSAPDGYTYVIGANTMAMVAWLHQNLGFDMRRDFAPVVYIADVPGVVTVTPSFPAANLRDLVAYAKANPGKVSYASSGPGSPQHIAAEFFNALTGIQTLHVPYKGAAPSWAAVMSGEVNLTFGAVSSALPLIRAGKLKALAAGSTKRLTLLPELPTAAEAGVPGYDFGFWYGIFAPARTQKEAVTRFQDDTLRILQEPEIREKLIPQGFELVGAPAPVLGELLERDLERWGKVIRAAKISSD